MKKIFSLSMTMILMLVLSVSAFAQSNEPAVITELPAEAGKVYDINDYVPDYLEISPYADYNVNWTFTKGQKQHGVSRFSMSKGNSISFNMSWSPEPGTVAFGLYNHNTGEYEWLKNDNSSPYADKVTATKTGVYSFAIHNTSTTTGITVTGKFTY